MNRLPTRWHSLLSLHSAALLDAGVDGRFIEYPHRTGLARVACRSEAIALRLEAIATRLEAIATRLEAIALRLEAIATRSEAIATRLEAIAIGKASCKKLKLKLQRIRQSHVPIGPTSLWFSI